MEHNVPFAKQRSLPPKDTSWKFSLQIRCIARQKNHAEAHGTEIAHKVKRLFISLYSKRLGTERG
jgi:hypothetical protein